LTQNDPESCKEREETSNLSKKELEARFDT
jgi:hypothetical protein